MNKSRALMGIAAGLGLIVGSGSPVQAAPPDPVTFEMDVKADDPAGSCDFPIRIEATGKAKTIVTPTGRTIGISANLTAEVTNLVTGETVEYSINGSFISTTDAVTGNVTTTATGRNLLTDPDAGVVVTSGTFTFTFDADENLVEGLSGTGRITDVCADLA